MTATTATIDLRSDTVTKPKPAMRTAMAQAEKLGVPRGERPTVARATAALLRALEQLPELVAAVSAAFHPHPFEGSAGKFAKHLGRD